MAFLLNFLTPKNIAIALILAALGFFSYQYWDRGKQIEDLTLEVGTLNAKLETNLTALKHCSDGVGKLQTAAFEADINAKKAMDQAKKESAVFEKQADEVLASKPLPGDTSEGYCKSADALFNEAIDRVQAEKDETK